MSVQLREVVLYDGIGSDPGFLHTKTRFIEIMNKEFTYADWKNMNPILKAIKCDFEDWVLPDDFIFFRFEDWLRYSGATLKEEVL
jgi:hypothetical protein